MTIIDLSDEAAAKLVEFLHEITEALERHYAAQMLRYYEGGPLIWPRITESEQNAFDATSRKLYRFLNQAKPRS